MSGFDSRSDKPKSRPRGTALQYAVKLLSAKSYSEKRLREKLAARQFDEGEITGAVARLKAERLLDDRRFAEEFVRARLATRPRSGMLLTRDLAQRGVPRNLAQTVVNELAPKENDLDVARELLRRKSGQYASLDDMTRRRRLMALLARRGFSYDTIEKALTRSRDDAD